MRVEIHDARKRFGRVGALRGVDLVVPAGGRVALVGPNGSGKSTLIRTLLGLIDYQGTVLLDGRSPYDDRVEIAAQLAYVPQVAPALGATVDEVVRLVTHTRDLDAAEVARVAALFDLDLARAGSQPFRNLSGGMKQKLLLSAAFAARPSLMVLDEPTASLDVRAREQFFSMCSQLDADVTLLLCSHRVEELRHLANRVVALDDGRVTFDGPVDQYLQANAALAAEVAHA
ncbi:MAG: ABC transporter ATP-binding protein [Deltaproteobacteria bacterium]|nr:ABC transporter ATP-binding protein [Deltaproteobacteria bacterium]